MYSYPPPPPLEIQQKIVADLEEGLATVADIRRRFDAGLKNFHEGYKEIVDYWTLYDNSDSVPKVIEQGE